jgi:DNA-binding transcriptional LysR family regulator
MAKIVDWDDHIGRRLRLRDLRVFFAVVQHGSLSKAAAHLRVSAPAVSQVIAELEHSLGAKLFDRNTRGVEPTVYATALLSRGRAAFDELKQGIRDIESLIDPEVGEVRIGCTTPVIETLLPDFIHRFSQRYPRVVLHVEDAPRFGVDLSSLRARKFDLIMGRVTTSPANDPRLADLNVEILFHDELIIAAGTQSRWARRRSIDLAELINEPWILASGDTWPYQRLAEAFHEARLEPPHASLMTISMTLGAYMLANGPYLMSFPRSALRRPPYSTALKQLPIKLPVRPWPVAIGTLKGRTLNPAVDRFIACCREAAKSYDT